MYQPLDNDDLVSRLSNMKDILDSDKNDFEKSIDIRMRVANQTLIVDVPVSKSLMSELEASCALHPTQIEMFIPYNQTIVD